MRMMRQREDLQMTSVHLIEFYIRTVYDDKPSVCKLLLQAFRMRTLVMAIDGMVRRAFDDGPGQERHDGLVGV